MSLKLTLSDLSKKTGIMGILNVTPDSFSDGGLFFDTGSAVKRGLQMENEGADIIDIGGESTRPGSEPVSVELELQRVIPVISELASRSGILISIDTNKPAVAREALKAGASIINDTMGVHLSREMAAVAAESGAIIVLMHIRGSPKDMQVNPVYRDLVPDIISELGESIKQAEAAGVDPAKIIIDPGLGFGKTYSHNIEILKRLKEFRVLGKPVLIGPSRKAFIGAALGIKDPKERLMGTAACAAIAAINGADIIRVHDVKEMAQVLKLVNEVYKR